MHEDGFGFKRPSVKYYHNDASTADYKRNVRLYIQPVPSSTCNASTVTRYLVISNLELTERQNFYKVLRWRVLEPLSFSSLSLFSM